MKINPLKKRTVIRKEGHLPFQDNRPDEFKEAKPPKADSGTKTTSAFDRVTNSLLSNSKETFNAWSPDMSQGIVYLMALKRAFSAVQSMVSSYRLIPIALRQSSQYIDLNKLQEHGY